MSSPEYLSRPPGLDFSISEGSPNHRHAFQQPIPHVNLMNDMRLTPTYGQSELLTSMQPDLNRSSMYTSEYYPSGPGVYQSEMGMYSNDLYHSGMHPYMDPMDVMDPIDRSGLNYSQDVYRSQRMDPIHYSERRMPANYPSSMNRSNYNPFVQEMNPLGTSQFNHSHMDAYTPPAPDWNHQMHQSSMYQSILPTTQPSMNQSSSLFPLNQSEGGRPLNLPFSSQDSSNLQFESEDLQLSTAIELRKKGSLDEALQMLQRIKDIQSPTEELYSELIRVYSDQGDFFNAEKEAEEGLQVLAENEVLLEKWIRIEERIGNTKKISQAVSALLNKDSYRVVKVIVDTCTNLCKLNNAYRVHTIFSTLFARNLCKQGNLIHHYATYLYRSVSAKQALEFIEVSLDNYPKHGPMWFTLFQYLEAHSIMSWDCKSVKERILIDKIYTYFEKAVSIMSMELRWKVFYVATQMVLRIITHLRIVLHTNVGVFIPCHW